MKRKFDSNLRGGNISLQNQAMLFCVIYIDRFINIAVFRIAFCVLGTFHCQITCQHDSLLIKMLT